jgi:hypothetical protein
MKGQKMIKNFCTMSLILFLPIMAGCGNQAGDSVGSQLASASGYKIDRSRFFSGVRNSFGSLNQSQVDGLNYLLANIEEDRRPAINNQSVWVRQIAYVFATTKHEVANTYQPITEYSDKFCPKYDGGCTYKGRGYVQLTHRYNYKKMGDILGVDLVSNPQRALEPNIAYNVMSHGMHYGLFTGKKLGDYVLAGTTDYYNARRVVNGLDKADLIKGYAQSFQTILENSTAGDTATSSGTVVIEKLDDREIKNLTIIASFMINGKRHYDWQDLGDFNGEFVLGLNGAGGELDAADDTFKGDFLYAESQQGGSPKIVIKKIDSREITDLVLWAKFEINGYTHQDYQQFGTFSGNHALVLDGNNASWDGNVFSGDLLRAK